MSTPPQDDDTQGQPVGPQRRRLGPGPGEEDPGKRSGCLITGAILGIIFGIMFALYGLRPILQAIYGEDEVGSGERYESDGLALQWSGFEIGVQPPANDVPPEGTEIVEAYLNVSATEPWDPAPADVRLEIDAQHEWIVSRPGSDEETSVAAGESKQLLFRFWVPPESQPFEVNALHIADPRLKMLPP